MYLRRARATPTSGFGRCVRTDIGARAVERKSGVGEFASWEGRPGKREGGIREALEMFCGDLRTLVR